MPRAKQSPAELRSEIVASAVHLFADQGYAGTSVKQIAESVGISKQLLLYHFSSKDELRHEILEWLASLWKDFLPTLLGAITGDGDPFDAAIQSWVDLFEAHPDVPRFVLRELITADSDVPAKILELVGPGMMLTADTLRRLQDSKDLDPEARPEAMLSMVGLVLLSVFAVQRTNRSPTAFDEGMVEEAMRMIRASFRRPKS